MAEAQYPRFTTYEKAAKQLDKNGFKICKGAMNPLHGTQFEGAPNTTNENYISFVKRMGDSNYQIFTYNIKTPRHENT